MHQLAAHKDNDHRDGIWTGKVVNVRRSQSSGELKFHLFFHEDYDDDWCGEDELDQLIALREAHDQLKGACQSPVVYHDEDTDEPDD